MSANRTHRALQSRNGPKQKALGCVKFPPLPEAVLCNLGLVFFRLPVTLVSTSFSSSHDYSRGGGRQLPNCCSKTGVGGAALFLSFLAKYSPPSAHYPHLSPSQCLSLSLRGVDNGGVLFSSRFPPPPSRVGRFETWSMEATAATEDACNLRPATVRLRAFMSQELIHSNNVFGVRKPQMGKLQMLSLDRLA